LNPWSEWIRGLLWCNMIEVILDHWSWARSHHSNAPSVASYYALSVSRYVITVSWCDIYVILRHIQPFQVMLCMLIPVIPMQCHSLKIFMPRDQYYLCDSHVSLCVLCWLVGYVKSMPQSNHSDYNSTSFPGSLFSASLGPWLRLVTWQPVTQTIPPG